MINTAQQLPTSTGGLAASGPRPAAHWVAHNNAIFDVKWCQVSGVDAASSFAGKGHLLDGAASQQLGWAVALLPQKSPEGRHLKAGLAIPALALLPPGSPADQPALTATQQSPADLAVTLPRPLPLAC